MPDTSDARPEMKHSVKGRAILTLPRIIGIGAAVISITLISLFVPRFFTVRNLFNIIVQTSPIGIMAIGLTFVLITGGIDLSQPSIMAMASVLGAMYMVRTGNAVIGVIIILAVSVGLGLFNGFAVAKLKMIPFVVTLAMKVVAVGLAVWFTDATSVFGLPEGFINLLTAKIGPIPIPVIFLLIFALIMHFLLSKTMYGRKVYSVGLNINTARVSGINTTAMLLGVYMISGVFAGLAGILTTARLGSAAASMGADTVVLDVISAAVIGGVSIYGGIGTVGGAVLGALLITIMSNIMNILGISFYTTSIVKGLIIVIATGANAFRNVADRKAPWGIRLK